MGCDDSTPGISGDNPPDLMATLTGLIELRLAVRPDADLRCVEIVFANLAERCALVLAPNDALELSLRLIGSVARLKGWEASA